MSVAAAIPGDPESVRALARKIDGYAEDAAVAAVELRRIDTDAWIGDAAEAFAGAVGEVPDRLSSGVAALTSAGRALSNYAEALETAQEDAARALETIEQADASSAAWSQEVSAYEAAAAGAGEDGPPRPRPAAVDPGADLRAQAQAQLAAAREAVETAARAAAATLEAAGEEAPNEPGLLRKLWEGAKDAFGSLVEGGARLGGLVFRFSASYLMLAPAEFAEPISDGVGLLSRGITRPILFARDVVDWWINPESWPAGTLPPTEQHLPTWSALPIGRAFEALVARGSIQMKDGSHIRYYKIGAQPGRGEVQVDLFISRENSWILEGDDRGPTSTREKSSRVRLVIDFETGRVKAIVFPSRITSAGDEPAVKIDDDRLRITENSDGTVRIKYNLVNSVTHNDGGGLLQGLEGGAIQGRITLRPQRNGTFDVITDRDYYPSLEVYQYAGAETRTLARERETYVPVFEMPNTLTAHTEQHNNADQDPLPGFK